MSVKDRIKRTSKLFIRSFDDEELFEPHNAAEDTTQPDSKKSGDFHEAKASTDGLVSVDKDVSGAADEPKDADKAAGKISDKAEKATGKVATATEKLSDAAHDAKDKTESKVTKDDSFVARRKSFFRRKPAPEAKENGEGFSKELKKLQRVLSKVKRNNKLVSKDELAANGDVEKAADKGASAAKGQEEKGKAAAERAEMDKSVTDEAEALIATITTEVK